MGIRCDQHMGLTKPALALVQGNRVLHHTSTTQLVYPDGRVEVFGPTEVYVQDVKRKESADSYFGMFGDVYPLYDYHFPDGRVLSEAVQAEPWSSGPVFFLALKDADGNWVKESLWPEEEIEKA